jgi:hypothetical protein
MERKTYQITLLSLICLGIYLFVSAPPPLEETKATQAVIPIAEMFAVLEAENDAVRMLWAQEFVGEGKKAGLKFHEHWRDADMEAGPLPAQFLRETAKSLEKNPSPLSLFLGSDYPINPANRFDEAQLERFRVLRQGRQPQFFYMADTGMQVGMFEDLVVAEACIQCHNKHEDSPKKDWALHDVMGATTWMYPASAVSLEDLIRTIAALEQGFDDAYAAYLDKVKTFAKPPEVGERWPHEGYFVPSAAVFKQEVLRRTAPHTLQVIAAIVGTLPGKTTEASHVAAQ